MNEALEWTAAEAVSHIRRGSITAERYASQLLKRHRETMSLNAFISLDEERVLEAARAVDVARSGGKRLGPLAGLPLAIKDNIHVAGYPTTTGVSALKDYFPERNARVVDILLENGAVVLGKASLDELGREFTNSNEVYGFAHNPYDTTRVPGGGAGGTAVALAARVTPAGLGSDTAGSARVPASYCGVVGLRPSTSGRLRSWVTGSWTSTSLEDGFVPISSAVSHIGPMGRTVADVALLNAVVTGTPMPERLPLRGVRIGVPRGYFWEDIEPEVARVSEQALEKLRAAGVTLVEVNLREWAQAAAPVFLAIATLHGMKDLADYLARNGSPATIEQVIEGLRNKDVRFRTKNIIEHPVTPAQAEDAVKTRIRLAIEFEDMFRRQQIAAIVYPTVAILPPVIRPNGDDITDTIDLNGKPVNEFSISLRNTCAAGVVGVPALNVPAGLSSNGLPVGLSFSSVADCDSRLLGLAMSLEAALGRLPAPRLQLDKTDDRPGAGNVVPRILPPLSSSGAQPPAQPPQPPDATDDTARVFAMLRDSAYLNVLGSFDTPDPNRPGAFTAKAPLRRYDVDFRLGGCEMGLRAVNQLGEECGRADLNWTFRQGDNSGPSGGTRDFTFDDTLVFDDGGQNRIRGTGAGRVFPALFSGEGFGVQANGNIVEGAGIFAGVQGSYVLTGTCEGSRLNVHFAIRLMDPSGMYHTDAELLCLEGARHGARFLTTLAFLGEPDPENPVRLTPTGAVVHELLRAVHTNFDRRRSRDDLRATISLGPVVARWRTDVIFNPRDPNAPGTPDRPMPVRLENIKINFLDSADETLDATITDGRGYAMTFPGISGPLFRMTGFGPLGQGTGRLRKLRGTISMLGALELFPSTFSNYYLLHIADHEGRFHC
jgi:mandelamide amidase